jgi:hypothetical protein
VLVLRVSVTCLVLRVQCYVLFVIVSVTVSVSTLKKRGSEMSYVDITLVLRVMCYVLCVTCYVLRVSVTC